MAIYWSARQVAECDWFVSLDGFDSVALWNSYLLANSLPQDCTVDNIGTQLYPWRTWQAVVNDARTATNDKVAVGLGRWGADVQRSAFTKSFYWLGQAGTVIDMQLCTAIPFRALTNPETFDSLKTVNSEFRNFATYVANRINLRNCFFDRFSSVLGTYFYNCLIQYLTSTSLGAAYLYNSTAVNSVGAGFGGFAQNSIVTNIISGSQIFYCCAQSGLASGYFGSFVANPMFNDRNAGDYTLSSISPCLYAGKNNAHIGCYGEALRIDPNNATFAPGTATYSQTGGLDDVVKTPYDIGGVTYYQFVRRSGVTSGNVRSGWISLGMVRNIDVVRLVQDVFFDANGGYAQCSSDSLERLRIGIYTALTEQEKAGAVMQWVDHDTPGIAVDAMFISIHVFLTGDSPAP